MELKRMGEFRQDTVRIAPTSGPTRKQVATYYPASGSPVICREGSSLRAYSGSTNR